MAVVVLIDDEILILKALELVVAQWGCEVVAGCSEDEAIAKLDVRCAPDLMIVDWRLREGKTGGQAVERIRAMYHRTIPAIVVTGETAVERLHEIKALGCPVVHKPMSPVMLKTLVEQALNRSDPSQEPPSGTRPVS